MKVYVLLHESGAYSSKWTEPLGAFRSIEDADVCVQKVADGLRAQREKLGDKYEPEPEELELFEAVLGGAEEPVRVRAWSNWDYQNRRHVYDLLPSTAD